MMFSTLALSLGLFGIASAQDVDGVPSFASFLAQHGRVYAVGTKEYEHRRSLFESRVAEVRRHNSKPQRAWNARVNYLFDRTEEELSSLRGWKGRARPAGSRSVGQVARHDGQKKLFLGQSEKVVIPENHTWGDLQAIKADVNQGGCGSCWAVATMTMMNAADEIAGNKRSFAAQDLVNCVPNPYSCGGQGGCRGATVELAMDWISKYGMRTTDDSPYQAQDGECYASLLEHHTMSAAAPSRFLSNDVGDINSDVKNHYQYGNSLDATIAVGQHSTESASLGAKLGVKYWTRLPENEYKPLLQHLVEYGPVAVSVSANGWYAYGNGIFDLCATDAIIDHAVVLFGYGKDVEKDMKFWDIKNSWGRSWGEDGNIRLPRSETVKCGIDRQPEVGTGCDGGPKEVKVCGECGILYDVVSVAMDKLA
mmetsp:Transcript_44726/g.74403  ORF Transcript_44726/g.74403 Transcript_44726/m.74403 type:complete len:423 (+) Transcript_44726:88-1356(+)